VEDRREGKHVFYWDDGKTLASLESTSTDNMKQKGGKAEAEWTTGVRSSGTYT